MQKSALIQHVPVSPMANQQLSQAPNNPPTSNRFVSIAPNFQYPRRSCAANIPGLVELRPAQPPSSDLLSGLMQRQWLSNRERIFRVERDYRSLGKLALLPLHVRRQIYEACFPSEYLDDDPDEVKEQQTTGLIALMRCNRTIYKEMKRIVEKRLQSRLFSLLLSRKAIRFERCYYALHHSAPDRYISPLALFWRTRSLARNLRLVFHVEPEVPVALAGAASSLEELIMPVFSLLSGSKFLYGLLLEFHLRHDFPTIALTHDCRSEMSIVELVKTLLGAQASALCQTLIAKALEASIEVFRVVVRKKERNGHQKKTISSFRWNRSNHHVNLAARVGTQQNMSLLQSPQSITESGAQPRGSFLVRDKISSTPVEDANKSESQRYRPPSGSANESTRPLPELLTHQAARQVNARPLTTHSPAPYVESHEVKKTLDRLLIETIAIGSAKVSREGSTPPPKATENSEVNLARSIESLERSKSPVNSLFVSSESESSTNTPSTQTNLKRGHEAVIMNEGHKRRRIDFGDRASTAESQARSSGKSSSIQKARSNPNSADEATTEDEYVVQSLRDARTRNGVPEIKVKWYGYDRMTWEPRSVLIEDVPDMVRKFDKRYLNSEKLIKREPAQVSPSITAEAAQLKDSNRVTRPSADMENSEPARLEDWMLPQGDGNSTTAGSSSNKLTPDFGLPKKPPTAYFLFKEANRPRIWEELCANFGSPDRITPKLIGDEFIRQWVRMEKSEREVWDRMHAKRLTIYHIQLNAWKTGKPAVSQQHARALVESRTTQASLIDLT